MLCLSSLSPLSIQLAPSGQSHCCDSREGEDQAGGFGCRNQDAPDLSPRKIGGNLAEKIYGEFPHSIFFTSKLIFERDNWYIRQLHSEAALTMLRRLHLRNMPMVILPMKL